MADRTVNVNIKYNVNTGEVLKAQAASQAAQKATDDLRKATEAYGKAGVKANKEVSQSTQALSKDFNDLYSSVKLVLTGGIAKEIISVTLEMAKMAGQIDGVSKAFSRLPNATLLLDDMRKSTHGTLTDLELMQKTLQASNFRIPLQNLGKLFEFAAAKAQQTGQEVNHLVDYIVSGIGYRSIKRLDDLGFTANRVKEALGGVSLQAATMGQVMDAVTKLMDEDLKKTGNFTETTAEQVKQLETQWTKLKTTVSGILTSPAVLTFYQNALDLLNRGANVLAGKGTSGAQKDDAIRDAKLIHERLLTQEILKDKQKTYDVIQQEANTLQQNIGRNNDEIKVLKEKFDLITNSGKAVSYEQDKEVKEIVKQIQYYDYKNGVLKETIRILNEYNKSIELVTEKDRVGLVTAKKNEIDTLNEQIESTTSLPMLKNLNLQLLIAQDQLKELLSMFSSTTFRALNDNEKSLLKTTKRTGAQFLADMQVQINEHQISKPLEAKVKPGFSPTDWQKFTDDFEANWRGILDQGIMDTNNFLMGIQDAEIQSYQRRIQAAQDYYDTQLSLSGETETKKTDFEKAQQRRRLDIEEARNKEVTKLQRELALKEWEAKRNSIILSTAGGIARAFLDYQWPYALIPAGIVAVQGGEQLAIANKNKPKFAKGVIDLKGPGSGTSDSIDAKLSRGESVMTAKETRESFGILNDIRMGKLNDKVLRHITVNGGSQSFDDSRVVDAIKKISQPNYVKLADDIYEVKKDRDGNKRIQRSRFLS